MESVLAQTSKDFEYIVVNKTSPQPSPKERENEASQNSTDIETLLSFVKEELVEEGNSRLSPFGGVGGGRICNQNGFTRCTWLSSVRGRRVGGGFFSEPDNGIYHAMNKGIRMAQGEYIHFLNSGDWLVDKHVVEDMLNFLNPLTPSPSPRGEGLGVRCDVLIGNVIAVRPDGKVRYKKYNPDVSLYTFYRGTIEHTSAYIRRDLFDKYGLYDENLKIVSDWKWYLQVVGLNKARVQFTDRYVTCFDTSGISSTNIQLDKAERRRVLEELLPAAVLADYDIYSFDIDQMQRLKSYPLIYKSVWFVERCLFKLDKWNAKWWGWRKMK